VCTAVVKGADLTTIQGRFVVANIRPLSLPLSHSVKPAHLFLPAGWCWFIARPCGIVLWHADCTSDATIRTLRRDASLSAAGVCHQITTTSVSISLSLSLYVCVCVLLSVHIQWLKWTDVRSLRLRVLPHAGLLASEPSCFASRLAGEIDLTRTITTLWLILRPVMFCDAHSFSAACHSSAGTDASHRLLFPFFTSTRWQGPIFFTGCSLQQKRETSCVNGEWSWARTCLQYVHWVSSLPISVFFFNKCPAANRHLYPVATVVTS